MSPQSTELYYRTLVSLPITIVVIMPPIITIRESRQHNAVYPTRGPYQPTAQLSSLRHLLDYRPMTSSSGCAAGSSSSCDISRDITQASVFAYGEFRTLPTNAEASNLLISSTFQHTISINTSTIRNTSPCYQCR